MSFNEIKTLLESYGFVFLTMQGGSHAKVTYPQNPELFNRLLKPIPQNKNPVKEIYIKMAIKWIGMIEENEE